MRSLARPSTKPATPAQKNQRLKMSIVSGWLRPLLGVINIGYQSFSGVLTPMNACVSYHLKNALTGADSVCEMDYSKAIFSRGELLNSTIREIQQMAGCQLLVKWENASPSLFCAGNDQANFVFYNPDKQAYLTFENIADRSAKKVSLKMAESFTGDAIYGWMHFTNTATGMVSTSVYLGQVFIWL
ncbi:hypothetical protein DBR11_17335 [Pedobacter sp. HMWF019]|uniref:DUF6266 family protein n=1 Tax=Pedobacter sp. HMWF019 TaxID=2056856 RepID=UPI000D36A229|nr:DUF6266 family protein [Pedobacter sp. HMWF019]PTS97368.1 hypothetical protein DBR11_17335 [Pedobacter sp. HMWF019]